MLRIDVPVWFNAVCYMSVTVKAKGKVLLLVFVEPSMIVVAFPSTDWKTGMELELRTRVGTGVNLPGIPRGWTAMVHRLQCTGGRSPSQKGENRPLINSVPYTVEYSYVVPRGARPQ